MHKIIISLLLLLLLHGCAYGAACNLESYFREQYVNVVSNLPEDNDRKILDIIYNAYAIKFQGLEREFEDKIERYNCVLNNPDCEKEDIKFQKKAIDNVLYIALEEYDAFLEDMKFEAAECDPKLKRKIDKSGKRSRKELKKLIKKNCKKPRAFIRRKNKSCP